MPDADGTLHVDAGQRRLVETLERLLTIQATELTGVLAAASQVMVEALGADKVDVFLHDPASDSLVVSGASDTPMARRQCALGLDRLPLANGGHTVEVFKTGVSHHTGHADQDPAVSLGLSQGLHVRSLIDASLDLGGERRGVVEVVSTQPGRFSTVDQRFVEIVAGWIGAVAHHAELVERDTRARIAQAQSAAAEELINQLAPALQALVTPLQGLLTLVRTRAQHEDRRDYLQNAIDADLALRRLAQVLTEALDVGRLKHGLLRMSAQSVDLAALATSVAGRLDVPRTDLRVEAHDAPVISGDPARLGQVLETLFSYALHRSPVGIAVVVTVDTEARLEGGWIVLSVHDEGPVIAPALLPAHFRRSAPGAPITGSLYLARGIAEAHGGTLGVESAAAGGTTYSLAVPVTPRERPETMAPPAVVPVEGRRILLVDGDVAGRTAISGYLEARGYLVMFAGDGVEALATVRTALPDLVVLDASTADLDGLTTLREIRVVSSVPLIMLSLLHAEDDKVQALRLGADDYLTLPVGYRELFAHIESTLRRAAGLTALPTGPLVVDADLTIDFGRNRVILRGKEAALTAHEHRMLYHLVTNAGRLMPYEVLLARVWGPEYRGDEHYVRLYVSYLRAKIEPDSRRPKYILTEKGLGYRFTDLQRRAPVPGHGAAGG